MKTIPATRSKFEKLYTISGEKIEVRPNHKTRTFTIKKNGSKYRTIQLNREKFNLCLYHTGNDWKNFLKSSDYYRI
jgi:Leucine-rich repeat (LRR) protein